MKRLYFLSAVFVMIVSGCSSTTIQQTIYLGDVKVDAPITPPAVHVTIDKKAGDITFTPSLSMNTLQHINSNVNDRYGERVSLPNNSSYIPPDHNLNWRLPSVVAGVDVDAAASNNFAVFGGLRYSNSGSEDLIGGNFGIGLYSQGKNPAARFDVGLSFQRYNYNAITIVQTKTTTSGKTTEDLIMFHDRGNTTNVNPFISFTLNSVNEGTPLNYFISLNYFTQKLLNFEPRDSYIDYSVFNTKVYTTDLRSETTCGFIGIGPGFTYEFSDKLRFVGTIRILKEVLSLKQFNDWIIIPSAQIDIQF